MPPELPGTEPEITFWSVPPFRRRVQTVARTITVRDTRFIVAQLFGIFYGLYGVKIPIIVLIASGPTIGWKVLDFTLIPVLLAVPFVGLVVCGLAGFAVAWFVIGRAIHSRRHSRIRWAIWMSLGMAAPALPAVGIGDSRQLPVAVGAFTLLLLFGAAVGLAAHWVVERDQLHPADGSSLK